MVASLNFLSLVLGLLAWILPILGLKKLNNKTLIYSFLSFSSMAISILFQLMSQKTYALKEDLSAILDTIEFSIELAWFLLIITVLFNGIVFYRYIKHVNGQKTRLESLNLSLLFFSMIPFLLWFLSYVLINSINLIMVINVFLYLLLVILTSYKHINAIRFSVLIIFILSVEFHLFSLSEPISNHLNLSLLITFILYYLSLNAINMKLLKR